MLSNLRKVAHKNEVILLGPSARPGRRVRGTLRMGPANVFDHQPPARLGAPVGCMVLLGAWQTTIVFE